MELSFRQFIERQEVKPGFTQGVADNLGVPPDQQAKVGFPVGNVEIMNRLIGMGYTNVKFLYDTQGNPTKALVDIHDTPANSVSQKDKDGVWVTSPKPPTIKKKLIDLGDLDSLRTLEVPPNGQMPAAGGPAAAPPGGGLGGM
jgi:hypothetical protein